jgi:PKD repeat protein/pimeloyl-ACP methyl ester carboxylesterase
MRSDKRPVRANAAQIILRAITSSRFLASIAILLLFTVMTLTATLMPATAHAQRADEENPGSVTLTPYLVKSDAGFPVMAEWGRLVVPERRDDPDSPRIETSFLRFKTKAAEPGPPIIFLDDGPKLDPSALADPSRYLPLVAIFGPTSDVIIMEQRGGGEARPRLDCADAYDITLSRPATQDRMARLASAYAATCSRRWSTAGVDPAGYNALEMAEDVESLRQALGYEKVSLLGIGFGSHVGLTLIKERPATVDRAAFVLIQGPDQTLILPDSVQSQLERLDARVKADPVVSQQIPDFIGLVAQVLLDLQQNPVTTTVTDPATDEPIDITVGMLDLQRATSLALAHTDQRSLPARYYAMSQGDYTWLGKQALESRHRVDAGLLPSAVKCASGANEERLSLTEEQTPNTILGGVINGVWLETCASIGDVDLGDNFRTPVETDTPVLLINGNMDALTPDSNGADVTGGLENGQLLIVDGASHDLLSEALPIITPPLVAFMLGDPMAPIDAPALAVPFQLEPIPIQPVQIDSWLGEYFNNRDLAGEPALVRDDPAIDFLWGEESPTPEITADNFSVRWNKSLDLPAGVYRFAIWADNGVRLWINDVLVLDKWTEGPLRNFIVDVSLVRGAHNARLEYFNGTGPAAVRMNVSQVQAFPEWKAEYFDNVNLNGEPMVVRNEERLDYHWGQAAPAPGVPATNWSARWSRRVGFEEGDYTFTVDVSGGARLWLDGHLLIANWVDQGARRLQANSGVLARGDHDLRVEYFKADGDGSLQVAWMPAQSATPPAARISGPTRGQVGQSLIYDGSASTSADGAELIAYDWDFGDGLTGSGPRVEHTYVQPELYNVMLTVTDEQDLTDTVGIQVRVDETAIPPAPDQPPVAVITAPAQGLLDEPIIFDAANSQSANPIVSFAWQFGDGSQADAVRVAKIYNAPGMYNVTLTVTDDQGLQNAATQLILIVAPTPTSSAPLEATPTPPPPPTLIPTATPPATSEPVETPPTAIPPTPTLNPGAAPAQPTPTFTPVGYSPQLTPTPTQATNSPPPGSEIGPTAVISAKINGADVLPYTVRPEGGVVKVSVNQDIVFNATNSTPGSSQIVNYRWEFLNIPDSVHTTDVVPFRFQAEGTYELQLTVTDANGLSGTALWFIEVGP